MAEQDPSLPAFARRMTAWRLSNLDRQLVRAQSDRSPDTVHDLRVAARRLQYTLDSFRHVLESPGLGRLRKRVKAILTAGRSVRDCDIALEMASEAGVGTGSGLVKALTEQRGAAAEALRILVGRPRFHGFERRWGERLGLAEGEGPTRKAPRRQTTGDSTLQPDWDVAESCLANACRVCPRLVSAFLAQGREICAGEPTAQELHRLRLAGKRLRYSLELFRGLYGPGLDGLLRTLKSVQTMLGEISDCDATAALLRSEGLADSEDGIELLLSIEESRRSNVGAFKLTWRGILERPAYEQSCVNLLGSAQA